MTVSGSFYLNSESIIGKAHTTGANDPRNVSLLPQMGNSMTSLHWMSSDGIVVVRKKLSALTWATSWRSLTETIQTWSSWVPNPSRQTFTTVWKRTQKSVSIQASTSTRVTTAIWFTPLVKSVIISIPSATTYFAQPILFPRKLQPS